MISDLKKGENYFEIKSTCIDKQPDSLVSWMQHLYDDFFLFIQKEYLGTFKLTLNLLFFLFYKGLKSHLYY